MNMDKILTYIGFACISMCYGFLIMLGAITGWNKFMNFGRVGETVDQLGYNCARILWFFIGLIFLMLGYLMLRAI